MSGRDWWTENRKTALRDLRAQGLSFSQVALAIGDGVSRSACRGKANRLGLVAPKRERKVRPLSIAAQRRKSRPVMPTVEPEATGPIREFPAAHSCRYIAGDVSEQWQCCGAPVVRFDIPWCLFHLRVVFQPMRARKAEEGPGALPKLATSFGTIGRRAHAPRGSEG